MTEVLVVDSSVLVAALCDSGPDGVWVASAVEQAARLAAPELAMFEATNTLRRLEISGAINSGTSETAFAALNEVQLDLWPFATLGERIWELRSSVTSYDAAFVALAELLNAPLVTLDQRLGRANGFRCEMRVPE